MLLTRPVLDRIVAGEVDLAFRLWKRPTVKAGGRLRTAVGELAIHDVAVVDPAQLDAEHARRAGFADVTTLRASVTPTQDAKPRSRTARPDATSQVYCIRLTYAGPDPRAALREQRLSDAEIDAMLARLSTMDRRSTRGPWVLQALDLIATWPARRASELAELAGWETAPWKANVRRLKELGFTESLPVGYRLSPRGEQVAQRLAVGSG